MVARKWGAEANEDGMCSQGVLSQTLSAFNNGHVAKAWLRAEPHCGMPRGTSQVIQSSGRVFYSTASAARAFIAASIADIVS